MSLRFSYQVTSESGEALLDMSGLWLGDEVLGAASDLFMMLHRTLILLGLPADFPHGFGAGESRHGMPYADEEIEVMKALRAQGCSFDVIARRVRRSPSAVQRKLHRL